MNNHQITIIYKVLSRLDKADYQSLVNTFEVQDDFKGFKLDETSLKNLHEIIKESNSVEEVIQVVNPSKNKKREITQSDVKTIKKSQTDRKKSLKEEAKALNIHEYISDYQVVGERTSIALGQKVKSFMKDGWVPWGGSTFGHPGAGILKVPDSHFQAMVKFKY